MGQNGAVLMNDGMSGWERMLSEQSEELKRLRKFVADHRDTTRLREALQIVRDRIDGTIAENWRDNKAYPDTLIIYITRILNESYNNAENEKC